MLCEVIKKEKEMTTEVMEMLLRLPEDAAVHCRAG